MNDLEKKSIECLKNMPIEEATYQVARSVTLDCITNLQEELEEEKRIEEASLDTINNLQEENKRLSNVIQEIQEKIDDYFGYDYENESQARLDTLNEINHIIVELKDGDD